MSNSFRIPASQLPRLVIIGGGFASISLIRALKKTAFQVILIDKNNFHTFQPLLYQVATAAVGSSSIIKPFRDYFEKYPNFYFRMAEVNFVDSEQKIVHTSIGEISYDYLVVATGANTNYFGNKELEKLAFPLKTIEEAIRLRNHVLNNFEKALLVENEEEMNSLIDYVVVGGGPTGVEVAGALAELKNNIFCQDYKELDILREMDIYLIQSGDRLLPGMSEKSSEKALRYLYKLGVNVILQDKVVSYDGYTVKLGSGKQIISRTVIWGAGVSGAPIKGFKQEAITNSNRFLVNSYNQIQGYEDVFAIGDLACMTTEKYPKGHPQMAQPAIQQGKLLAKNLMRKLNNQALVPFEYSDKGSMATVGKNLAVADTKLFSIQGVMAWVLWGFVHVMAVAGMRNKLSLIFDWVWSYFKTEKSHRVIIGGSRFEKA